MNKMKLKTFIRAYERGQKCLGTRLYSEANSAIKAAETEFKRINKVNGCHLSYP